METKKGVPKTEIIKHYEQNWGNSYAKQKYKSGPMPGLNPEFCILEFKPHDDRNMWTYATSGMSNVISRQAVELHLFSAVKDESLIELLTAIAHYHKAGHHLNLHHTVNFGRPWQGGSAATHGFISLPYLDGPELEDTKIDGKKVKFYWLIPITERELKYKKDKGVEALEIAFAEAGLDYINPHRKSVV